MSLAIHLGCELAPLGILAVTILVGKQCHCLHGEGQQGLRTLLIEPFHKALLQPRKTIPIGLRTVGEVEVAEDRLKVIAVIVSDIPEHGLIVTGTCGLVQCVDNLLKIVSDDLVDRALLQTEVSLIVWALPIVQAILLADEVVHVHQELGCCAGATKHRADHEHHVDESASKRLQVGGGCRVTTDAGRTTDKPGVHRDRCTIVRQRCLIIFINEVVSQLVNIFVGQFFAVHLFNTVGKQTAVQTDKV